jgi:hypothetical protein
MQVIDKNDKNISRLGEGGLAHKIERQKQNNNYVATFPIYQLLQISNTP